MADGSVPGSGPEELGSVNPTHPQLDTNEQQQRQQDLARIREITDKPGVREVLERFDQQFRQNLDRNLGKGGVRGTISVYGIRADGLVVAVSHATGVVNLQSASHADILRAMWGHHDAWILDTNLQPDQIESKIFHTRIPGTDVYAMRNGSLHWPRSGNIEELANLPDEEIRRRVPDNPDIVENVKFYKRIGGGFGRRASFDMSSRPGDKPLDPKPSAGKYRLYPLNLK